MGTSIQNFAKNLKGAGPLALVAALKSILWSGAAELLDTKGWRACLPHSLSSSAVYWAGFAPRTDPVRTSKITLFGVRIDAAPTDIAC